MTKIQSSLSMADAETIIHAFVPSRLYALLPKTVVRSDQIQNNYIILSNQIIPQKSDLDLIRLHDKVVRLKDRVIKLHQII